MGTKNAHEDPQSRLNGHCLRIFSRYHTDGEDFLNRIVTGDKFWVAQVNAETKQKSMAWDHTGSPTRLRKAHQTLSARSSSKVFKKRRGNFNQGRRSNSESTVTSDSVPQQFSTSNSNVSASEKKLCNLNNSYKSEFNSGFKNVIVDLNVLAGVFSEAVKCLQCGATGLNLSCEENCSGGAVELDILCDFCSYSYKFCSSKQCKAEIGKPSTYEINTSGKGIKQLTPFLYMVDYVYS
ncbi:uncharacterized protein TNCT_25161 [Trichonephila clavata]|uniref:Uncharacterized protein n=1 Tax=Trichonephila clavata TaxID=2740835 RepID=A0A8X6FAY3_TRICU|nr:uncharacterized protein TNCT_25161 [Trichonephila clavata]